MVSGEDTTTATAPRARDLAATLVGWALLIGGVAAAVGWLPVALLPGGFILVDAPSAGEALRAGVWSGTVAASLLLLAVAGVVLGVGVLRHGRAGLNRSLTWVAFGVAGVAALSQHVWLLGAGALAALAVVLVALRRPAAAGAEPRT